MVEDEGQQRPLRTLRLHVEYDGSRFSGWQQQSRERTVQGALEGAVRRVLAEPRACVVGAGRTDAEAHAVGQVAHVRTVSPIPPRALLLGVNSLLERDVRVRAVEEAPAGFHARFSSTAKEYRYQVWVGPPVPPFLRSYCHGVPSPLDHEAMARAARLVEGTHDLSTFRAAGCSAASPLRTVYESRVGSAGPMVVYAIRARGFLMHMVRILVGTLLEVGKGVRDEAGFRAAVAARDRTAAGATAPARGLFLFRVEYGDEHVEARPEPVLTCSFR